MADQWVTGETVTSTLGQYVYTGIVSEPDDNGNTVWQCTRKDGRTTYMVLDWIKHSK